VSDGVAPNSSLVTAVHDAGAEALAGLQTSFHEAAEAAGGAIEHRFNIAEGTVSVQSAGRAVADLLTPAFTHLGSSDEAPMLTIHAWDMATTATERPEFAPPESADGDGVRPDASGPGLSHHYDDANFQALHQPGPDVLSVLSARADVGWFWTRDMRQLPHWDYAAPFRHLLSWWLDVRGYQHVHGGAVGTPSDGVLLVGRGGSGKSTTALATLGDPRLRYAGDDYVALGGGASPFVHSLYCSGKVHASDLSRLPYLRAAVTNPGRLEDEKAVLYVPRAFPEAATVGFPLRAILMPRVTDRRAARVIESTQAAALSALAPSTILQRRPPQPKTLTELARVVERIPAYVLEVGSDAMTIPDAILEVLA
jgi:hypothetical protein